MMDKKELECAIPEMIDLTAKGVGEPQTQSTVARRRGEPVRPNMFSATSRSPRVKKMAKGRRGWVVDYVIPESEPQSESETGT